MTRVCLSYRDPLISRYEAALMPLPDDRLRTVVAEWNALPLYRRALRRFSDQRKRVVAARELLARREEAQQMSAFLATDGLVERLEEPTL